MMVVIDKHIPVPTKRVSPWRDIARKMVDGDSVLVDDSFQAAALGSSLRNAGKGYRRETQKDGSVRVWCVDK